MLVLSQNFVFHDSSVTFRDSTSTKLCIFMTLNNESQEGYESFW